jgi:dTDP-4-dehydrorhamnose reductase
MRVWCVTGASGQVGSHLVDVILSACETDVVVAPMRRAGANSARRAPVLRHPTAADRLEVVLVDGPSDITELVTTRRRYFDVVVHLAAVTSIAEARANPEAADAVNGVWTRELAAAVQARTANPAERRSSLPLFVYASTDMVFDGEQNRSLIDQRDSASTGVLSVNFYRARESKPDPLSHYGRSKLAGEQATLQAAPRTGIVVRLPLMFGAANRLAPSPFTATLRQLRAADSGVVHAFGDEFRTPLSYRDAAELLRSVAVAWVTRSQAGDGGGREDLGRVFHLSGPRVSRKELLQATAAAVDSPAVVEGSSQAKFNLTAPEPRPQDLSMATDTTDALLGRTDVVSASSEEYLRVACRQAVALEDELECLRESQADN